MLVMLQDWQLLSFLWLCGSAPYILAPFLSYTHHPVKWPDWAQYTKSAHVSKKTIVASPGAWQAYLGLDYVMSGIIQPCLPFYYRFPSCSDRSVTQLSISARWDAPTEPTNHCTVSQPLQKIKNNNFSKMHFLLYFIQLYTRVPQNPLFTKRNIFILACWQLNIDE